ncbi:hypothetical protein BgiBS90_013598 [Biomphalaria glabrata]|nr:hypothetical protein BgiBS90_013598 [Biomphalaria glabrata]
MNLFGLHGMRPLSLARISGMRLLKVRRRDTSPVSTISYLHHATALSATVVKNVTGAIGQAGGEMAHTSSSSSSSFAGDDRASFIESHAQYSFIAVVALMSLFLVITISATGLLLAFCRKKNAVFTAPSKPEADSNLELDDIDGSDVDFCRGDKGECYYHLSDDDDDSTGEDAEIGDDDSEKEAERVKRLSKRSRTFPQLKRILGRHRGNKSIGAKETRISTVIEPLMSKDDSANVLNRTIDSNLDNSGQEPQRAKAIVCRNPNHRHYNRQHHNCLYNRPHYHQKSQHRVSGHQSHRSTCCSKLHRSHTIHYIPQTAPKTQSQRAQAACGVQIKVQDMEVIMSDDRRVEPAEVGTVQLHYIPTVSSSVRYDANSIDHTDDLFNETEESFSNLQLRLDVALCSDTHATPTADVYNNNCNNDFLTEEKLRTFVDTYSAHQTTSMVNGAPTGCSRLMGDFLTCSTGSASSNDCIFSRDKPPSDIISDSTAQEQLGHVQHPSNEIQLPPNGFTPFQNLLKHTQASELEYAAQSFSSKHMNSSETDHKYPKYAVSTACLHTPAETSSKKCIHHSGIDDHTLSNWDTSPIGNIDHCDFLASQRGNGQPFPWPHYNSNSSIGERSTSGHSASALDGPTVKTEFPVKNTFQCDFLILSGNGNRSNPEKRTLENNNEDEPNDKLNEIKTCNDLFTDDEEEDLTLTLLK